MREIQASEAKTHLASLLDEVERGETLVITRHGRAMARLVPAYLELARRRGEPLATLDRKLAAAAESVALIGAA